MQDPGKVLLKAGLGSLRSSAFLGVFVVIDQSKLISLFWSLILHKNRINFMPPSLALPFF